MTYAVQKDIDDLYGEDLLKKIADQNRNGIPDPSIVERGLKSADGIINGYLEGRYTIPLQGTSDMLTEVAVDIAVYKIALQRAIRTTEMRQRYEDALALLDKVAAGKVGLGIDPTDGDGSENPGTGTTFGGRGRSIDTYRK